MDAFKRAFDRVELIFYGVSLLAIFLMMIIITCDAVGRYFLRNPIDGAFELVQNYLMVAAVFLSVSYTYRINGHIRLELFNKYFSPRLKGFFFYLINIFPLVLFALICYQGSIKAWEAWKGREVIVGIVSWPTFFSYIWIPLGSGLLTLRIFLVLIERAFRGFWPASAGTSGLEE